MPTAHEASFESASPNQLRRLTSVLHPLISRLESNTPGAAYNLIVRTAPWIDGQGAWSHWRIELLPRVNAFAGLELATGININHLAPERAARLLRLE
jgi:galactose-1-phosphate uridylyltransferase